MATSSRDSCFWLLWRRTLLALWLCAVGARAADESAFNTEVSRYRRCERLRAPLGIANDRNALFKAVNTKQGFSSVLPLKVLFDLGVYFYNVTLIKLTIVVLNVTHLLNGVLT